MTTASATIDGTVAEGLTVGTTAGIVRGGRAARGVRVFRGIPYARPPVGELRFAAPQPATAWTGVRDALTFGPAVPQSANARRGSAVPPDATDGDNYLTVNVWTPRTDGSRPVMVWIHGGAYMGGGTATASFEAGRLAADGQVVVVTVNHRVAMEGYAQIVGAPANRGLLDVTAALEWVQYNIAGFGGDPGSVTIFGQSAGAGAVAALLAMPAARGLFHRAIAQSVPGTFLTPALASAITARVAADLGCAPTVDDLGQVNPVELAETADAVGRRMLQYAESWGVVAETNTPFSPVVDGVVLPTDPWMALATGAAADVPLIVGHTRDEFRAFTRASGTVPDITEEQARHAIGVFGPDGAVDAYYRVLDASGTATDPVSAYETVNSDWLFRMPSAHLALAGSAGGAPTYLFELAYTVPKWQGLLGAPHSADHPLVFGNFEGGVADRMYVSPVDADTERLGDRMRQAWAEFAYTGKPGWDEFTSDGLQTMVLDTEPRQEPYPHALTLQAYRRPEVLDLA